MRLSIYTDGGSRGNPGHSGYGFAVFDNHDNLVHQASQYLGIKTNNEAEYQGLLSALTWLQTYSQTNTITSADFFMDSELIVRQLQGDYKVKAANLLPIFSQVKKVLSCLNFPINFIHVLRHKNKLADQLANLAMDYGQSQN